MILHSDQGSVYASKAYNDLLPMYVVRSMSRAGTPTDNSAMESINGWIKAELFMDFHVTGERPVYEEVNEYIYEATSCCGDVTRQRKIKEISRQILSPAEGKFGIQIPAGAWHTINVIEPSVIFEAKDGAYNESGNTTDKE